MVEGMQVIGNVYHNSLLKLNQPWGVISATTMPTYYYWLTICYFS
jgi:hypothetical protein